MKRIAFVDKWMDEGTAESLAGRLRAKGNEVIVDGLRSLYEVKIYCDIEKSETYEKIIGDSRNSEPYHAVITHIMAYIPSQTEFRLLEFSGRVRQRDMEGHCCRINGASLDNIDSIHKQFPETKIMAYTYIPYSVLPDEKLREYGVSHALRRRLEEGSSADARINAKRDLEMLKERLNTERMSRLEKITEEQLKRAVERMEKSGFLEEAAGASTNMITEYGPKLKDALTCDGVENIRQVLSIYFNRLYPNFQKKFWKAVSVNAFVGQMADVAAALFPHLEDDIQSWERTYGEDLIKMYTGWNKEKREWHPW